MEDEPKTLLVTLTGKDRPGVTSAIFGALSAAGLSVLGGVNAPYIWLKTPGGQTSWDFFDTLLSKAHLVGTPGSGFGSCGEGYFRLSAFNSRANIEEALARVTRLLK